MKVRWTAEPRALADQREVTTGDVIDVPDDVATSLINQGLAERAGTKKEKD